jgi:hypothetical protein
MVPLEPKDGSADAVNTIIQAITSGFPERKSGAVEINAHAGWLTPVNLVHTRGTTVFTVFAHTLVRGSTYRQRPGE